MTLYVPNICFSICTSIASAAIYLNTSRKLLYEINHYNNNTWLRLTRHSCQHLNFFWWLTQCDRTEWPNGSIPPNVHMLEGHATGFVEKWWAGWIVNSQWVQSTQNNVLSEVACFKTQACYKSNTGASI